MEWLVLGLLLVGAYLVGAIPNGLLVGRLMGRDLLRHGSGKTGTANTMSALGRGPAALVFALDLLKGVLVALAARLIPWPSDEWGSLALGGAASVAIAGHNWSVWVRLLSGKWGGGRGIVTALGAMLLVNPLVVLVAAVVGAVVLFVSRYVVVATLAGMMGGLATAVLLVAAGQVSPWLLPGCLAWGALVAWGFHDSIGRLLRGEETKV